MFWQQRLAERHLGLVSVAEPGSFEWAGNWIGTPLRDADGARRTPRRHRRQGHDPGRRRRIRSTMTGESPGTIASVAEGQLVYSTDGGTRRRRNDESRSAPHSAQALPDDGIVRIFKEKGGRGGKTVTIVRGLPAGDLDRLAAELKRRCGAGGAVKSGAVEIQGDHREQAAEFLRRQGYRVKLAGG